MRIFRLFLAILIFVPSMVSAQMRITSVSVGSGEDAIASGITGIVRFVSMDSSRYAELALQQEQAWYAFGKKLNGRISGFAAISVGHFQGAAWAGPYVSLSTPIAKLGGKDLKLSTLQWPAFFIGGEPRNWKNDGVKNPESVLYGYLANVGLTWGPVTVSESYLNFLDDPANSLPGASLEVPISALAKGDFAFTWNKNAEKPMYYMGLTFKFGR